MEEGLKRGWTNSFYCSEYELAIFRKGVESGRKALRNKIQSLQAELEAVKAEKEILKTGVKVLQNALPDMCDFITDNRGICKEGCVYSQLCLAQKENGEIDILAMRKLAELLKGKENT